MTIFASITVPAGSAPVLNRNAVAFITAEAEGSRLHLVDRPSMLSSLAPADAAETLGFKVVTSPEDVAETVGPTLISLTRSRASSPALISLSEICYIQPTADDGAIVHMCVTGTGPAIATDLSVSHLAELIGARVVSLSRKGSAAPSLITRAAVVSVVPRHDGTTGAVLTLRDGNRFDTDSDVAEVLAALNAPAS